MWKLSETLGNRTLVPADTANLNFQNSNLVDGMRGEYNFLGNLGSPRLSRIFFERNARVGSIFLEPLRSFYFTPEDFYFTNSNVPYTNLSYHKGGDKLTGEERFKSYFSVNANKRLAFGFNIDYLYGRGSYANQSTAHFNAGIFASYIGQRYQMQALYNNFVMKMNENGGITDDRYITRPEDMAEGHKEYESSNIPVRLSQTTNRNKQFFVYLTHRYRLGFHRTTDSRGNPVAAPKKVQPQAPSEPAAADSLVHPADSVGAERLALQNDTLPSAAPDPLMGMRPEEADTLIEEFVPVTSFIHTLKIERSRHSYQSLQEPQDMYADNYFELPYSRDSTYSFSVKNVLGIALLEGFNKYAKAGLTAYISHKYSRYELMALDRRSIDRYTEQEVFVGGELAKRQGKTLHYTLEGEIGTMGKALGQFEVKAHADLNFRLWKDTVNVRLRGAITNTLPSFYLRHYHSNHFFWDNEQMQKEFRTRLEGELNIDRWNTNLRAGVENVKHYTYFGTSALPEQHSGNIQVLSATLRQDFRLGILHLDSEVALQQSSNQTVLPLPSLSLYSNFYLLAKLAKKVLTVQLGADVRYFSAYEAPAYMPATQQFYLQPEEGRVQIGGYPIVNAYANLHLKRTRIYVMMTHINQGMGGRNYFMAPHYPINPRQFKIGLSWNFYD
jgi:hypothetical protein